MKIVPSNTYFWETKDSKTDITEMPTTYLINIVKFENRMAKSNREYEHPDCYDAIYVELNYRGVDTDLEIDFIF